MTIHAGVRLFEGSRSRSYGAILAALVSVAIAGCAGSVSTAAPTATVPPTPTTAPTASPTPVVTPAATPVPTPVPTPVAGPWSAVPDTASLKKIQFYAVAWTGTRFAAGGTTMDGSAVFLDSADGLSWNLQPAVWKDAVIRHVASGPSGLVAVGDLSGRMVVWTSPDGLTWTLAPDAPSMHPAKGNSLRVWDVAPAITGWIAVGEESHDCPTGCAPTRAAVWTSPDAKVWTQAPASPSLAAAAREGVVAWKGGYVAVGKAGKFAAVWTSPDGAAWARVPDVAAFHTPAGTDPEIGAGMKAIVAGTDRLVAAGMVFSMGDVNSSMAWWSPDAGTWNSATGEKFLHGQIFGLAAVPTGYLAVGPSGSPSCLGGIWSSPDGAAWKCEASASGFSGFYPVSTAASPTREIAVGYGRPGGAMTGAVWTRQLTAP